MNKLKRIPICFLLISFSLLTACSLLPSAEPPVITKPYASITLSSLDETESTVIAGPDVVVEKIELVANPATSPETIPDPSSEISEMLLSYYRPSKAILELYNDLYRAVLNESDTFDLSAYDLPLSDKITACDLLNEESNFHLPYLQICDYSADYSTVYFLYETSDTKKIMLDRETLSARLGQLLYNVPPEGRSEIARFASVFQYICETTDSAPLMAGPLLAGPDSLLLENSGICWGYAQLLNYVAPRIGIPSSIISNDSHTWNLVSINGKLYHTDLSFAAGSFGSPYNYFETFLMDDTERERTLMDSALAPSESYLGLIGNAYDAPPPCDDKSFQVYGSIHDTYALDVEHEKIYVSDYMGIKSMNLDGSSLVTLSQKYVASMVFFDGVLYFTDYTDGNLYSLVPGQKPLLLDGEGDNEIVLLDGATLSYGSASYPEKHLRLLPSASEIEAVGFSALPTTEANRSLSYYFSVTFSTPMDRNVDWNQFAILTDNNGDPLLTRQTWNEDGTVMTVRPLHSVDECKSLTFYLLSGAPSQENGTLPQTVSLPVSIDSVANHFPAS